MKRKKKLWIFVILMAVAAFLIYGVWGGKEGEPGNLIHAQDENTHNVLIVYYS